MEEFKKLVAIADRLLGPEGCPWDKEQTFFTLQPYLLEETHELIEAIDEQNPGKISEELGDVLYALIFIAKLGEQAATFTLPEAIRQVSDKLIRRHPHIFSSQKVASSDEVLANWEEIKKKEGKKSPIANIPPTLPALARAQKVIHKLRRKKDSSVEQPLSSGLAQRLWDLIKEFDQENLDAESELRRLCQAYEENFEKKHRR